MKALIISLTLLILNSLSSLAQTPTQVYLPSGTTVHFTSPEPIQYADFPKNIAGDIPLKNVMRIKFIPDSIPGNGVVTIAGETFIAQYQIVYVHDNDIKINTNIEILPSQLRPLELSAGVLSDNELKRYAMQVLANKPTGHYAKTRSFGINGYVSRLWTLGDYIFLDLKYQNLTNLSYDIDQIRFRIEDRKVTKASNVQSVEIQPESILFSLPGFKKHYRNVFVFRKFSFPGNKLLKIEMTEKQISGRVVTMDLRYGALLDADVLQQR
ncbi:MAG: DUF4138 domain-containing protein [Pedobacter sp.]|nr:MAG: DUF4138 domain-containing protein [Pedobacter sp.]